jgi:hypothetical protein
VLAHCPAAGCAWGQAGWLHHGRPRPGLRAAAPPVGDGRERFRALQSQQWLRVDSGHRSCKRKQIKYKQQLKTRPRQRGRRRQRVISGHRSVHLPRARRERLWACGEIKGCAKPPQRAAAEKQKPRAQNTAATAAAARGFAARTSPGRQVLPAQRPRRHPLPGSTRSSGCARWGSSSRSVSR